MHILFLTDNFPPEVNAPAIRTFEHAREWIKEGHQVTVITCAPNYPKGKLFAGYKNKLWQEETIDGIRVIRVWSYITANEGFSKRILDFMSYMVTSFFAAHFVRRVDLVVGTSPQFFTACSAWAVSAIKRRPFVFELRDIWPESIRAVSAMASSSALDFLEKVELFLYRRARVIVVVTHSFKENLISRGIVGAKIHVVTNGVDTTRFQPRERDAELLEQLELREKFVVGYIGTHGMAHALDTLVEAARLMKKDPEAQDVEVLLVGGGANRRKLIEQARDLDNIQFLESVPRDLVGRYWSLLDASIIHLRKSELFQTVIPSKMFECMAMGIPVLHGVEGESADILARIQGGITFEPQDASALVDAIKQMKTNPDLQDRMRANGIKGAALYDRKVLARDMLDVLDNL